MKPITSKVTASITISLLLALGSATLQARAASLIDDFEHCTWGDFGCTNPPPEAASPGVKSDVKTPRALSSGSAGRGS